MLFRSDAQTDIRLGAVEVAQGQAALPDPLPWPRQWPTLRPGARYILKLQPSTSPDRAEVIIAGGSPSAFAQTQAQIERLGSRAIAWEQAISALLNSATSPNPANRALASTLLFASEAPPSEALSELRQALKRANCTPLGR